MSLALIKQQLARIQSQGASGEYLSVFRTNGTDDKAAIRDRINTAVAMGKRGIHFGDGQWTIDCEALDDDSYLITVPERFAVTGNGRGRSILNVVNTTQDAGGDGTEVFLYGSQTRFAGLHFRGDNGEDYDGSDFTYVLNNQNACIAGRGVTTKDVVIEDCHFEQLWGFSVHDRGENKRIHGFSLSFLNCANGYNNNADHSLHIDFVGLRSEGPEVSGARCVYATWTFEECQGVGASFGGNQGIEKPGSQAVNITIDGSTGNGIVITDGFCLSSLSNVVVRHCAQAGLVVLSDGVVPVRDITFNNVTIDTNCADPNLGVIVGVDIRKVHADDGGFSFFNCRFTDRGEAGYKQIQAFSLNAPNCSVDSCVFQGHTATPTNKDASFGPDCTNLKLGASNTFKNGTQEFLSGCTIAASELLGIATTDRVFEFRIWNDSAGAGRRRWAIRRDGWQTWGNGLDLEDTNLYRRDADQLKTDDKFLATGGIGVGNSANASSSVGSLVKKIEVFDASGNSLGYIPVYSSIT